ncbi:MAG TPA: OmpA family protein [Cyclobacteriaceae bacterium]|nr:OmpA family protein [Cyclobacteriaceae bacterium]
MVFKVNLVLPLFLCALITQGQPSKGTLEASFTNHVVIGAFSSRENAVRFTDEAKQSNPDVVFNINPDRKLFYVYVVKTADRVQAFAEARRLRKESKYWDTWVYYGALGESDVIASVTRNKTHQNNTQELKTNPQISSDKPAEVQKSDSAIEAEVKAYSMADEPKGLDLDKMINASQTKAQKEYYKEIKSVKESVVKLNKETKVIVFKDDKEGRQALKALGYEIGEDKPISGFFDSKNNILAINATESQSDEPFHEGLKPVIKFIRKKNPEKFETFTEKAKGINHPLRGVSYGELNATGEEALGNMMADVAQGYFESSEDLKGEATTLMGEILETLGVESVGIALNGDHLKTTATNLAVAVREATGFDAEGNRKFKFDLFNTMNLNKVKGEVDLVNESSRKISSYPSNEVVKVLKADASGNIILACEVLGYRKLLFKLNYDNPFLTEGVTKGENDEAIVPFGLVRLQKGDIAVMYNVYFFKDAAIMRPESRYEINNLLSMMNENSAYKIMIHGHTNGNAAGKIITMGETRNFFTLTNTQEGRGSAKKLSEKRAEVIREYLMDQGIEEGRMEIKAWGGKRPLYDKNHSLAQSNVRVEIEIIEN